MIYILRPGGLTIRLQLNHEDLENIKPRRPCIRAS